MNQLEVKLFLFIRDREALMVSRLPWIGIPAAPGEGSLYEIAERALDGQDRLVDLGHTRLALVEPDQEWDGKPATFLLYECRDAQVHPASTDSAWRSLDIADHRYDITVACARRHLDKGAGNGKAA